MSSFVGKWKIVNAGGYNPGPHKKSVQQKRRDPRKPTEFQIQSAVVSYLRLNALPGVLFLHVANETGGAGARRGAMNKALGVVPGVFDLLLIRKRTFVNSAFPLVLWLEFKAPGGRLSKGQKDFAMAAADSGCAWDCADSVDGALDILKRGGWCR